MIERSDERRWRNDDHDGGLEAERPDASRPLNAGVLSAFSSRPLRTLAPHPSRRLRAGRRIGPAPPALLAANSHDDVGRERECASGPSRSRSRQSRWPGPVPEFPRRLLRVRVATNRSLRTPISTVPRFSGRTSRTAPQRTAGWEIVPCWRTDITRVEELLHRDAGHQDRPSAGPSRPRRTVCLYRCWSSGRWVDRRPPGDRTVTATPSTATCRAPSGPPGEHSDERPGVLPAGGRQGSPPGARCTSRRVSR